MTPSDFTAWVALMRSNGWTKAECAKRLGCGVNQINVWAAKGAPLYIALACSALCQGWGEWKSDPNKPAT